MTDMQFQTTAGAFSDAAKLAALAVDKKSTMPILMTLRLEADVAGNVKVNGSNLSLNASARFAATVGQAGGAAVDQQRLTEILSRLPSDKKLTAKIKEGRLHVTCGSSKYEMAALPAEDFPTPPKPAAQSLELPAELLVELLSTVAHAMLDDDQRAHLSGIMLRWGASKVSAVATDGARLALLTKPLEGKAVGSVFVPHRAVAVLRKFCDGLRGSVVHLAAGEYLHAWCGDSGVSCKLLEEMKAPPYDKVAEMGRGAKSGFTADRQKLVDALERLRAASAKGAESGAVRVFCDKEAGRVDLTSDDNECSGREAAKAEVLGDGETLVSGEQMIAALKAFSSEKAKVRFSAGDPVTIEPAVEAPQFLGLCMPLRMP